MGYSPWGLKRAGHDLVTKQNQWLRLCASKVKGAGLILGPGTKTFRGVAKKTNKKQKDPLSLLPPEIQVAGTKSWTF